MFTVVIAGTGGGTIGARGGMGDSGRDTGGRVGDNWAGVKMRGESGATDDRGEVGCEIGSRTGEGGR